MIQDNVQINIPHEVVEKLCKAQRVVVLTGAGTSAESGVPTFRDAQTGLWEKYDPTELATPEAYQRNPRLVWEWYAWRRELVQQAQPNPGHFALVEMEQHVPHFTLITQNVDGMHQRAGSKHVIELHGNIMRTKRWNDNVLVDTWQETGELPPRCPETGSMLRPDVVWFGESLPEDALRESMVATTSCDVFFSIGTSGIVQPAATLPYLALDSGATLVVINLEVTPHIARETYHIAGPSGRVLPVLMQMVLEEKKQR